MARRRIAFMRPHPDSPPQAGEEKSRESLGGDSALQRGCQADLRSGEGPGDGTGLLRLLGDAFEGRLIDAGHAALRAQLDLGDGPAFVDLVEMDPGRGSEFLWRRPRLRRGTQYPHGEITGFRCA